MEKNNMVSLESLVSAAVKEEWGFVDEKIEKGFDITTAVMSWAISLGMKSEDKNVRDLAATILDKSDLEINPVDVGVLKGIMEKDPYDIVRFRIAIALSKRGDKSPAVEKMMLEAREDPNVGETANKYYNQS